MKKITRTIMQMHRECLAFLHRNLSKFAGNQPMTDAIIELEGKIGEEEALQRAITKKIKGFASGKQIARRRLGELTDAMRRKVQAWYMGNNDPVGFENANVTYSEVVYGSALNGIANAQIVHDLAGAMSAPDRAAYMITAGELTALQSQINIVITLNTDRRSMVVSRKTSGALLVDTVSNTSKYIHDNIDSLMGGYRVSDNAMYMEYLNARIIESAPGRHAEITGTVMIDKTTTPIPGVKVTATNGVQTFEDMTDTKGRFKMPVSPELYNLKFELKNFDTVNVQDILVDAAEKETVNITLERAN